VLEYSPLKRMLSVHAKAEAGGFSWGRAASQTMQVYNHAIASKGR
jgi:hypothetical protein